MYVRESAGLDRAVNPCPSGHKSFAHSFIFMVLKQAIAKSMKIIFDRYNLLAPRIQPLGVHWTPLVKDDIIFFNAVTSYLLFTVAEVCSFGFLQFGLNTLVFCNILSFVILIC